MKHSHICTRLTALLLCVMLLPVSALADWVRDDLPVTRSDFELRFKLHADGFPADGAAHYQDWETFIDQLSVKGVIDTQLFLDPLSRVGMDASLCLNGKEYVPFRYDGYSTYRYVRSPALEGASIHFQMINFLEFMLKGYYFMDLPTPLIGLLMYPENAYDLAMAYWQPVQELFDGVEEGEVEYTRLYELCETLDLLSTEDPYMNPVYFFVTALLVSTGASDTLLYRLSYLEDVLETMDPDEEGMTVINDGDTRRYVLGDTTVLEQAADGWRLCLADSDGYVLNASWQDTGAELHFAITVWLEEEERLGLRFDLDGLPADGQLSAEGSACITLSGEALYEQPSPVNFTYQYTRSAESLPYDTALQLDWLHPQTGAPALSLSYSAAMSDVDYTVLADRPFDNQDDFFHLNDSYMEEYKERFTKSLALAFAPFVLHMPAGCLSDAYAFLDNTGFLAFLGIE